MNTLKDAVINFILAIIASAFVLSAAILLWAMCYVILKWSAEFLGWA